MLRVGRHQLGLVDRHRARQVGEQPVEVGVGLRGVRPLQPLVVLAQVETALVQGLPELVGHGRAIGVRSAHLVPPVHD
ncbi:hypothetical protein GCM10027615_04800 [Plantactinospora veratri]